MCAKCVCGAARCCATMRFHAILLCFLVNQRIIIADVVVVGTAVFVHTGGYIGLFCFGFGALSACHALAIMYIAYILYILFDDDFGACMVGCW